MGWKYYNHAMVPDTPPHETVDTTLIKNGKIWKFGGGTPLFARWTSDFDCGYETNWWYVIKDDEYNISTLKAKRRYEITKSRKNFKVEIINPNECCEEMFDVQSDAFAAYPEKYRPTQDLTAFREDILNWNGICFAAFSTINDKPNIMCGYAYVAQDEQRINFIFQKTRPDYEKYGVNAALVDAILMHFNDEIKNSLKYISDGQRSTNHETAFQDYLEKYFGFRKAYCKLNIVYRPSIRWLIPILYIFRKVLKKFDNIKSFHLVNAVLAMEEIKRNINKNE